ncbi:hypothetical protein DFO66_11622 [Brevibacterium sanguinis]|uniref:DUF3558 domain-containing protein n=2 Tax=Brevibacterium TaxID=1696 RepID=A0A366IGK5_9MICO|nr:MULTISPECIES: hypothetical protein [Brevibacterium]RBP62206.1 hypothetical protein DFO66_11622 [Brevibacterium sanguinis]RBP70662.1 hypothetical protein DFO65_108114 [Brevibacterium celere]
MRRSRAVSAALITVVVGLLAGCTTTLTPLPPVDRDVPPPAADRDAAEVRTRLAALDPCALLDSETSADLGIDDGDKWRELFSCVLHERVRVEVYSELGQHQRFWEDEIALAGTKAYRNSEKLGRCAISIPVDHEHAIVFSQDTDYGYDCAEPEAFASRAVQSLSADSSTYQRRDDDGIVACDVFAPLVGTPPTGMVIEPREGLGASLDRCGLWREDDSGFVAVHPEKGLLFRYSEPLQTLRADGRFDDYPLLTIDGTDVLLFSSDPDDEADDDGSCRLLWDAKTASARSDGDVIRAEVEAATCTDAIALAEEAVPAVKAAKPAQASGPVPLYSADENDGPAVGACADALSPAERLCAPVPDSVEIPDAPAEVMMESEADPTVLCAAARSTVQDEFANPGLTGVTALREATLREDDEAVCEFVESRHSLVVRLQASTGTLDSVAPAGASFTEVNGHAAIIGEAETEGWNSNRRAQIALGEATEPGYLDIEIVARPDRKQGTWEGATVDTSPLDLIEELSAALTDKLLE